MLKPTVKIGTKFNVHYYFKTVLKIGLTQKGMITENRFPLLKNTFFFFLAKMKEKYLFSYYKKQNIFFLVILK